MSLRRCLTALLSSLGVLVPSATLPPGGYLGCLGTPPPAAAELSLPMAAPPAEAHIPTPPAPDPIWPIGVSNAEIYRLTERGLGLPYDIGHAFVSEYGRFFADLEEVSQFRTHGEVEGLEPWQPRYRTWAERPTGVPVPIESGGFEVPATEHGAPEVALVRGWHPWFRPTIAPGYNHRPEYKPEALRVRAGQQSQKMFTTYATHDAGFAQAAAVEPGQRLRFSIWVSVWTSSFDEPRASYRPGSYCVQAGIDDTWSEPVEAYDRWVRLEVEATATSQAVLLRTRGMMEHPVKHNDSYWDDALLEILPP